MYNYAQTVSKTARLVISISKTDGYNDIVLNTYPSTEKNLNISIHSSIIDKGFISIYDLTGNLIKQEEVIIQNGENNYTVGVNDVHSNIYRVKISGTFFNTSKEIILD